MKCANFQKDRMGCSSSVIRIPVFNLRVAVFSGGQSAFFAMLSKKTLFSGVSSGITGNLSPTITTSDAGRHLRDVVTGNCMWSTVAGLEGYLCIPRAGPLDTDSAVAENPAARLRQC